MTTGNGGKDEVQVKTEPKVRPKRAAATRAGPSRTADDGWNLVGGAGKCAGCIKEGEDCAINVAAIEKWRTACRSGTVNQRAPPHTSCKRCLERKKACELPATKEMRDRMQRMGSEAAPSLAATASSGTKRRREVEVEIPVMTRKAKRARRASPAMTDGEFRKGLLTVLREIEGHLGRLVAAGERLEGGSKGKGKEKAVEVSDDEGLEEVPIEDRRSLAGTSGRTEDGEEEEEEDGVVKEMVEDS